VDWINRTQDKNQWLICEYGNEFPGSVNCGEFFD
jgi:hypothetical protein